MNAADVLSEINGKVYERVSKYHAQQGGLHPQLEETLTHVAFVEIAQATLENYSGRKVNVRGRSFINTLVNASRMYMNDRNSSLRSGDDVEMPQIADRELSDSCANAGVQGMGIRTTGWTAEDFRSGVPPTGGKYASWEECQVKGGKNTEASDWAKASAKKQYDTREKSVQDIINTMPRKHQIQDQTYVLDVKATLKAADLHSFSPGYHMIESTLITERDDPEKQDELLKLYAQAELANFGPASEVDDELELDD